MNQRFFWRLLLVASILVMGPRNGELTTVFREGQVPTWWPKSLALLQPRVKFCDTGPGLNQAYYQIPFENREDFEQAWPVLLSLKTPGAPLTLYKIGRVPKEQRFFEDMFSFDEPAVFMFAPSPLNVSDALQAGPPWPSSIVSAKGELPEYVESRKINGELTWVPFERGSSDSIGSGVIVRARIDLALVIDEAVIDLNRISLPGETPIRDLRFVEMDRGQ